MTKAVPRGYHYSTGVNRALREGKNFNAMKHLEPLLDADRCDKDLKIWEIRRLSKNFSFM